MVLFFGQIRSVKGLDTAIRAIAALKDEVPNIRLVVAGKLLKDDLERYKQVIAETGVEDNVILHLGYVPQEKVDYYYYACDAIVLPYRKIYQSGVLLMAMSYGIPVIASDLEGMKDIINHGENGLLFPVDDYNELASAVLRIIEDNLFAERIGRRGKEYVTDRHDWYNIALKTAEFYKDVLKLQ